MSIIPEAPEGYHWEFKLPRKGESYLSLTGSLSISIFDFKGDRKPTLVKDVDEWQEIVNGLPLCKGTWVAQDQNCCIHAYRLKPSINDIGTEWYTHVTSYVPLAKINVPKGLNWKDSLRVVEK